MASAASSKPALYTLPALKIHCGEMYCSESLEEFYINCTACNEEFNLICFPSFMKHVIKCRSTKIIESEDLVEQKYTAKNMVSIPVKSESIAESEHNYDEPHCINERLVLSDSEKDLPLTEETNDVESSEYSAQADYGNLSELSQIDVILDIIELYRKYNFLWYKKAPLFKNQFIRKKGFNKIADFINKKYETMVAGEDICRKIECLRAGIRKVKNSNKAIKLWYYDKLSFICEENCDDIENITRDQLEKMLDFEEPFNEVHARAYKEERKIELRPLSSRKIVTDILEQYKKCRPLWDIKSSKYKDFKAKKFLYGMIASFINSKHKTSVTETEIIRKIESLRAGYRRAVNRNKSGNQPITLWYFDMLSFVNENKHEGGEVNKQVEASFIKSEASNSEESLTEANQSIKHEQSEVSDEDEFDMESIDIKMEPLDEEPNQENVIKVDDFVAEEECSVPQEHSPQHAKEDENPPQLDVNPHSAHCEAEDVGKYISDTEESSHSEKHTTQDLNKWNSLMQLSVHKVIVDIIEQYKKYTHLWDRSMPQYNILSARKKSFNKIASYINEKYKIKVTGHHILKKIKVLRIGFCRALKKRMAGKPVTLWYYDKLAFVYENELHEYEREKARKNPGVIKDNEVAVAKVEASKPTVDELNAEREISDGNSAQDPTLRSDWVDRSQLTKRKVIVDIIEQYKKYRLLWDRRTKLYTDINMKNKAFRKMTNFLNKKYKTRFTVSQIVWKVKILRAGFRQAHRLTHKKHTKRVKLWYYDKLSFVYNKGTNRDEIADEFDLDTSDEEEVTNG